MAATIDFSTLNLNSEEARNTGELIFEKTYTRPELNAAHGIMTGIDMDRYIPILGQYGLIGKADPGSCSTNAVSAQSVSEKQWTPKLISGRITHCQDDLPDLLKVWKKSRIAANTWEEVDNDMMAFIEDTLSDAVMQSLLRVTSFGDTSADTVANGGQLVNGTDKTYFTILNGLWQQIFTDQAGSALMHRYTLAKNSEATYAAQMNLADDTALTMLEDMMANVDSRVFSGTPVIQMTRTLFENLKKTYRTKSFNFTLENAQNGFSGVSFDGVPIVVRYDWDRFIQTYFKDGTNYYLPHRCIMADINNIPVGTSDEESISRIDSHYDKTDKSHYLDFAYKIDVKALVEEEIAVAY